MREDKASSASSYGVALSSSFTKRKKSISSFNNKLMESNYEVSDNFTFFRVDLNLNRTSFQLANQTNTKYVKSIYMQRKYV